MIQIQILKTGENFKKLKVSGHAVTKKDNKGYFKSEKIEERIGENIICAAVSVLSQSFYLFCKKKEIVVYEKISNGFLEFEIEDLKVEIKSAFEMAEIGLINLRDQYPNEIVIVYI